MKKKFLSLTCFLLALLFLLPSCSSPLAITEEVKTKETVTEEKMTEEKKIMQKSDPKEDDVINILMIGNSFCYYYVEELYGIAKEAGVKMRVCNLYYSGCSLVQHWDWLRGDEAKYEYVTTDENGRKGKKNISMRVALQQQNWDVISLQLGSADVENPDRSKGYAKGLYEFLKREFPLSTHYWHQTWTYQVGYNRANGKVENKEQQDARHERNRSIAYAIATANEVPIIPSGDAWKLARENPVVGDVLCARLGVNNDIGDYYHDGDIGGGQYLNACVWFETLTGKSCIGNTWRPNYALSEEKIAALQQAAHTAVAGVYGEDYAK